MERAYIVGVLFQQLLAATSGGIAGDLASDLRNPCGSYSKARVSLLAETERRRDAAAQESLTAHDEDV